MNADAWIQGLKLKSEKLKNQTCHHYIKDSTGFIIFEHLLRWKIEYPKFFKNDPGNIYDKNTNRVIASNVQRKKYPKFCQASKGFVQFIEKQER